MIRLLLCTLAVTSATRHFLLVRFSLHAPCCYATADTPAQQVVALHNGISVRKRDKGSIYALSGLPLRRSQPMQEGWWLRGAALLLEVLLTQFKLLRTLQCRSPGW
jgi:hypothetical protein